MSQRLIRKTLVHPRTGNPLHPIGFRRDGRPIMPILGGDGTEESSGDGTEGAGEDAGGEGGGSDNGTEGSSTGGTDETVSRKDLDAVLERMKAADRRASEAEKKVKEYEDKGKSETERLQGQVKEYEEQNNALREEVSRLRMENAFALNSKHSWEDPQVVLTLVRTSYTNDITVDEDGNVKGLEAVLDKIAKEKQYLVKKAGGQDGTPSGVGVGSGKGGGKGGKSADELRKKYPALY